MDFTLLSYEDANKLIPDKSEDWFGINKLYAAGDHWQEGDGWSGPRLDSDHPLSGDALSYIERIFTAEDTLNEIMERHAEAIAGSEFSWSVVGRDEDVAAAGGGGGTAVNQVLLDEAEALLREWISERDPLSLIHDAVLASLWCGRGPLRLFVPAGKRDQSGMIPTEELALSIKRIYLEAPHPEQAAVIEDPITRNPLGIYTYTDENDNDVAELVYLNVEGERPLTVLRVTGGAEEEVQLDFGGRLTMFEIRRPRMMTDALVSNQKKLNHAATAEQSNLATAGFIARLILNGQMPGDYARDANGNLQLDSNGRPQFVADPMVWGPESVNFIVGVTTTDEFGNERIANPSYVREEPSPPDTFIETKDKTRRFMLSRTKQAHVFLADDGRVSGESRLRARGDFEGSLSRTKQAVDKAIVWLLESVLAMAATFSGKPEYFEVVRVTAEAQIDIGIVTPEERRVAVEMFQAGLVSRRTAMTWIGIHDIDGEMQQMEQEGAAGQQQQQPTAIPGKGATHEPETNVPEPAR